MIYNQLSISLAFVFGLGVLATPWYIGGNVPPLRTAGLAASACILLVMVLFPRKTLGTPTKLGLWLKAVLIIGIAWSAVQLISIGDESLSQYQAATRQRLCVLILAVSVFFAASHIFRYQALVPWAFAAVSLNGVLITFFGLAQTVSESDKLYWSVELIHGGQPFGPFVNGNNAGGYLIMCFAAANYFLALHIFRTLHQQQNAQVLSEKTTIQKLATSIGRSFARTEPQVLYIIAAVAVTAAGVAASLSRGAIVSLAIAVVVGWGLMFRRNLAFAAISILIVSAGIGLIFWTQQTEAIATNLESLTDLSNAAPNRLSHWEDSLAYSQAYLPYGSGLGTYNIFYMQFQDTTFNRWFKYAENQYLETLAELGIPGITILFSVLALGLIGCLKLLKKPDSASRAVGISGLICWVGQCTAAVFDFGWFIPGNMFLFATMMGIVFSQLNWSWSASNIAKRDQPMFPRTLTRIMAAILAILCVWATYEYSAVDCREACRRFYERFAPSEHRNDLPFYGRLSEYAVSIRPDDAQAHYQRALNHTLQYRCEAADNIVAEVELARQEYLDNFRKQNPESQPPEQPDFTFEMAWERTTLLGLQRVAWAANKENVAILDQIRSSPPIDDHLKPAWDHLKQARQLFDKYWYVDIGLAQLSLLMGELENEEAYIDDAIRKSLGSSKMLYAGGILYQQSDHPEKAYQAWSRCLSQTRKYDQPIIDFCKTEIPIADFFDRVLPTEPFFRLWAAKKYFGGEGDLLVKKLLLRHTKMKLDRHNLPESELNFVMGEIEQLSGNHPVSISYYRRALELEKHRVEWRIQLARSLIAAEMFEQAITELNLCELYHGDHQLICQRLLRQVKKLRIKKLKTSNGLDFN